MKKVIVAGATGLVGSTIISILEERNFPISEIKFLASKNSVGEKIKFKGKEIEIRELKASEFDGFDLAFLPWMDLFQKFSQKKLKKRS